MVRVSKSFIYDSYYNVPEWVILSIDLTQTCYIGSLNYEGVKFYLHIKYIMVPELYSIVICKLEVVSHCSNWYICMSQRVESA